MTRRKRRKFPSTTTENGVKIRVMVYLQFDYGEKVCYIKYEKGKSETHGLPYNIYVKSHARLAVTIGGSGGYFLSLKIS